MSRFPAASRPPEFFLERGGGCGGEKSFGKTEKNG
jgi:hypothetical protein